MRERKERKFEERNEREPIFFPNFFSVDETKTMAMVTAIVPQKTPFQG